MKEVFDLIKERLEREYLGKPVPEEFRNGIVKAIRIVSEVEAEYINKSTEHINKLNNWVDVKDRLPEAHDFVLCWYEYQAMQGKKEGAMVQKFGIGWYHNRTKLWCGEVSCGVDCRVLAWMPLPLPYKPEKGE